MPKMLPRIQTILVHITIPTAFAISCAGQKNMIVTAEVYASNVWAG